MKKIFFFLLAALLVLANSGSAYAENWQKFSKSNSEDLQYFYDSDSVKVNTSGDTVTFHMKSLNQKKNNENQLFDMEIREKIMLNPANTKLKATGHVATILRKRTCDTSGKLIKEEGKEELGFIVGSKWDFLEDVLIFAGHNNLYPEKKILMLNQYKIERYDAADIYYVANRIKKVGNGIEVYFVNDSGNGRISTSVTHFMIYQDKIIADKANVYVGNYYYMTEYGRRRDKDKGYLDLFKYFDEIAQS